MIATKYGVGATFCLLATAGVAWADVPPPPTFVLDSLYLGFPVGPIVALALVAAAVATFVVMKRRGVPKLWAAAICLLLFVAINCGIYSYSLKIPRPRRNLPPNQLPDIAPSRDGQ
jgi:hypothetical protein